MSATTPSTTTKAGAATDALAAACGPLAAGPGDPSFFSFLPPAVLLPAVCFCSGFLPLPVVCFCFLGVIAVMRSRRLCCSRAGRPCRELWWWHSLRLHRQRRVLRWLLPCHLLRSDSSFVALLLPSPADAPPVALTSRRSRRSWSMSWYRGALGIGATIFVLAVALEDERFGGCGPLKDGGCGALVFIPFNQTQFMDP
ncbi:hypothetical protein PHYSODRAFT_294889 [Phytophthora sojae]|uniref:Uncharacterized protein n=1 Tax=Phytophthora sojae (strain P6497) TaxID=1094619 RepID=G4YJH1_PHYSP|nr:hypothetical protein PHYSODRAFT_294889 [Phytophthora sojae]EGZ29926.1 hypothetical protein PHYSODRAFT_294889 [Phytophthora sojae]|eukprot:XP_009517201.1 hypothetical protein PHYSODRAFT_294889 [Phytophthora sojae]